MEQIIRDLKFGLRQLAKHPVFTLVAAVALGLGIGSVTTQLSVTKAIFLSGLPFPDSNRIAHIERVNPENSGFNAEIPVQELPLLREEQEAFEGLAGYYNGTVNLTFGNLVKRYDGCFISANAFALLRANAMLGRALQPSDDEPNSPDVVVLSHQTWENDFGADKDVVGAKAVVNGRTVTIAGVMPKGFAFPVKENIWIPLFKQQDVAALPIGEASATLEVFGRLKEDVDYEEAEAVMSTLATRFAQAYPETHAGYSSINVKPFVKEYIGGMTIPMSLSMLLITILILVIACANVANLLLARSMRRQKEIAIRSALGATRNRIISQFLTESILLAAIGAALGIIISMLNIENIKTMTIEMGTPFWMDFDFDGKVFIGVTIVTLFTGIASGLIPAIRASKINENEVLKDDTRTSSSLHMGAFSKSLVVVQISIAAFILTLVVLFIKSSNNALALDYQYNPDETMTARIGLFEDAYPDMQARANFVNALLERLRAHPAIDFASVSSRYQFLSGSSTSYRMRDSAGDAKVDDPAYARLQRVSPEFFETIQMPLISGRNFNPEDFTDGLPRHAIINEALAEREWPDQNPIGQRFRPQISFEGEVPDAELPWVEVIGVVGDMQEVNPYDTDFDGAGFYVPITSTTIQRFITVLVRGSQPASDLLPVMREVVRGMDGNLPLYETGTPRQINERLLKEFQFFSSIFRNFGVLATFLAAIGIYGVITFSVDQRIMEFGIRKALGATRSGVFKLVYAHALKQLLMGFLITVLLLSPIILSEGIRSWLAIFFYEIDPDSLTPYLLSFGFVAIVAILSAAPPAFRASRIHPAQALRYE